MGDGPAVIVIPGVLSMASDYAAFASTLGERFAVHTIERRGRGKSGSQGTNYSIMKECEDVLAVQQNTSAHLIVGHSYGGLIALEVARGNNEFTKIAVYEPGVSIDGSMRVHWIPGYEKKLAERRNLDALVEFTLADAPPHLAKLPPWLMKTLLRMLFIRFPQYRQMLSLLKENLEEWREIARIDSSYENYRQIIGAVLLMYGGRSESKAVNMVIERLPPVIPHAETHEFRQLDHFGIERTAPRKVAKVVGDYFLK